MTTDELRSEFERVVRALVVELEIAHMQAGVKELVALFRGEPGPFPILEALAQRESRGGK